MVEVVGGALGPDLIARVGGKSLQQRRNGLVDEGRSKCGQAWIAGPGCHSDHGAVTVGPDGQSLPTG